MYVLNRDGFYHIKIVSRNTFYGVVCRYHMTCRVKQQAIIFYSRIHVCLTRKNTKNIIISLLTDVRENVMPLVHYASVIM